MTAPFRSPTNPLPELPQHAEGRRNAIDRGGHRSVAAPSRDVEMPDVNPDSPPSSPSALDNLQSASKEVARRGLQNDRSRFQSPSPEPAPEANPRHTITTTPRAPRVLKLNYKSPPFAAEKGKWVAINHRPSPLSRADPAIARRLAKYSIRARPARMELLPPIDEALFDYARPHVRYRMCSMHTTKCNACLSKLKSGILFECADCRMHLCQGCVERRIEEIDGGLLAGRFDVHAPNHEGFVDAFLEWRDGDGDGKGKEGFVAGNGVVFEVKTYTKAKAKNANAAVTVKDAKGKGKGKDEKKKVPSKLNLRPLTEPTEPRRRGLRVNHRGQVRSRAAPHPLTPYPYPNPAEESWPNDLGLLNEVDETVSGVRGPANAAGGTDGGGGDAVTHTGATGATGAGAGRSPRPRRRISSTYSSGSDSDSDSDSAWIIQRTRSPAGDTAPGLGGSVLSEEAIMSTSSVATEDAEAAAVLVAMNREGEWERGYVWY